MRFVISLSRYIFFSAITVFLQTLFVYICFAQITKSEAENFASSAYDVYIRENEMAAMNIPIDKTALLIDTESGAQNFEVELAQTVEEKERGLMYRRDFPDNRAMLFVFAPQEQVIAMWMRNTLLPLDMIFADRSGKIVYIYENAAPYSGKLISSLHPVSYAAELKGGQAALRGIKAGQMLRHPIICGQCGE